MNRHTSRRPAGYSIVELLATLSILAVLVGLVSFGSSRPVDRAKLAHLLDVVEKVGSACERYHADTGRFAYEYSDTAAPHRRLSAPQREEGWSGPYLAAPLRHLVSNPFGSVHLYNDPRANDWIQGFDLDGDGAAEVTRDANMLWLSGIDGPMARALDRALDADVRGGWTAAGRVRYDGPRGFAWILVHP